MRIILALLGIFTALTIAAPAQAAAPSCTNLGHVDITATYGQSFQVQRYGAHTGYLCNRKPVDNNYRLRLYKAVPDTATDRKQLITALRGQGTFVACPGAVYTLAQHWLPEVTLSMWEANHFDRWARNYANRNGCEVYR